MVYFKDFGKTVTDLFKTDKYAFNRTLITKTKNKHSSWETEHALQASGNMTSKLVYKQTDESMGAIEVTVPTKGELKVDYSTPKMVDGLTSNLVFSESSVDLKNTYCNGAFQSKLDASMNPGSMSVGNVAAEASMGFDGFSVGGAVKLNPNSDKMLSDYNLGMQYAKSKDTTISVKTEARCEKISTMLWQRWCPRSEYAARYVLDLENPSAPSFDVGTKWQMDDAATMQGVLRSSGDAMFLYKHKLSERMTASIGCTMNVKTLTADSTNIHYKLEFEA